MQWQSIQTSLCALGEELGGGWARFTAHLTGGKLLRARLVLAAAALGEAPNCRRAIQYAALVELIHAGALFHDDVADRSPVRRGRPTLWSEVGVRAAVLAGAGLVVRGGAELAEAPLWLRRGVAEALREAARGQTDELGQRFSTTVSPEAYLRRARAKTGAFYELAARLGAAAGGLDARATDAVASFASTAGLAFQLADDARDLVGGTALGRSPGTDLRVGVYTLPVLLTTSGRLSGGDCLGALLEGGTLGACVSVLAGNGALAETAREARALLADAIASLDVLPPSPARFTLESYAADLLGPLPAARLVPPPSAEWCIEPASPTQRAARTPLLPGLAIALHPTLAHRLAHLTRHLDGPTIVAPIVAVGVALAVLGGDCGEAGEDGEVSANSAALLGSVDLLLADFFALLIDLPGPGAAVVCRALADLLMEAAHRAASEPGEPAWPDDERFATFADVVTRAAARVA